MSPSALPLSRLDAQLARRETELRAVVAGAAADHRELAAAEVTDFKEIAAEDTQALIDEAVTAKAAAELAEVIAARHRIADGSYGQCLECGEPIDERRLQALPTAPLCTTCQAGQEQRAAHRH
jgi:DnaK suppressor protein